MLQSLVDTFCELAVVENPRLAVGIVVISVIGDITRLLQFGCPHCYFRLSVNVAFICGHFLWGRKLCLAYCATRARITLILTSDLFGCTSLWVWLWLCSRWRLTTYYYFRFCPSSWFENVQIPLFILLPCHLTALSSLTFKNITSVKFISLLHRRTMMIVAKPVNVAVIQTGHVKPEVDIMIHSVSVASESPRDVLQCHK